MSLRFSASAAAAARENALAFSASLRAASLRISVALGIRSSMLSGMADGSWVIVGFSSAIRLGTVDCTPLIQIQQTVPREGTVPGAAAERSGAWKARNFERAVASGGAPIIYRSLFRVPTGRIP